MFPSIKSRASIALAVVVALSSACSEKRSAVQTEETPSVSQELKDLSYYPIGAGFDRGLDQAINAQCFVRAPTFVEFENRWEATAFTAFSEFDLLSNIKTAVKVGVKVKEVEGKFGVSAAQKIRSSEETRHFALLARFLSRVEMAGATTGPAPRCASLPPHSANGIEDFVSTCGDSFIERKDYGGHLLLLWSSDRRDTKKEEDIKVSFGANVKGAEIDAEAALSSLVTKGYGDEQLTVDSRGFTASPPVPQDGGFTVAYALQYLRDIRTAGQLSADGGSAQPFGAVVDYKLTPYNYADLRGCVAVNGRDAGLNATEWPCVQGELSALADLRHAHGPEQQDLRRIYEQHRLAANEQRTRVVFNTVEQAECDPIDSDGNPESEVSGPCQQARLDAFVQFYEACQAAAETTLATCRSPALLGTVSTCAAYRTGGCRTPTLNLPDGGVISGCSVEDIERALGTVIDYRVEPPPALAPPGAAFLPPIVLSITPDGPSREILPGPPHNVSPQTHVCGITGIAGYLHESQVELLPSGNKWIVHTRSAIKGDASRQVRLEVTCVSLQNFYFLNGGTHADPTEERLGPVPALNGSGFKKNLFTPGIAMLGGWTMYLGEPQTYVRLTPPDTLGFAEFHGGDLFPFESTQPKVFVWSAAGNPRSSGQRQGGSLSFLGTPNWPAWNGLPLPTDPDVVSIGFPVRDAANLAKALPVDAFCALTELSGTFYNVNDSVRISTSDGMSTFVASTPLSKDRNPGGRVQCVFYDGP